MPASSQKTSYPPKHKSTAKSHKSSNASKFSQGKNSKKRKEVVKKIYSKNLNSTLT